MVGRLKLRSPSLLVFLGIARYLRRQEGLLRAQNKLLEKLLLHLEPKAPEPLEDPDLLYADEELEAIEEMKEELRLRGYKIDQKTT